jgi:hypothetical protein
MWKIIQSEDTNTNNYYHFDEALPSCDHGSCRPVILLSCESNDQIVEWTDNTKLLSGAFLDKFLFGQGVPNGLLTEQTGSILQSFVHCSWIQSIAVCIVHSKLS